MNPRILKRILYVEDEADIQAVAKLALEAWAVSRWRCAIPVQVPWYGHLCSLQT